MRKIVTAIVATASIAGAALATPRPAEARCLGCWIGAGIAAGVIGGAIASSAYGYGYLLRRLLRSAPLLRAPILPLLIDR